MLRITHSSSAAGAKAYFDTSLRHADYYAEGKEIIGHWHGDAAARLGLHGEVTRDAFRSLIDNLHPETGQQLTPRMKADRRPGYDFTFNAPKSVSILHAITRDERLTAGLRRAVEATMADIELDVQARVRKGGKSENRVTGNLAWADFMHTTARPVDGVPDPHLHIHAYVPNLTYDVQEGRWKAIELGDVKADAPYYEAVFHSHLAREVRALGYGIERHGRYWDVAGVPRLLIEQFSRRSGEIEKTADALGITRPETKGQVGARTRNRKIEDLSDSELRDVWISRIGPVDRKALDSVIAAANGSDDGSAAIDSKGALAYALGHAFERGSVARERAVVTSALQRGFGDVTPAQIRQEVLSADLIRRSIEGKALVTTKAVLAEETAMLRFAREGRLTCRSLGPSVPRSLTFPLNDGQKRAVEHVLTSRDRVMVIRGGAGTGKTTLMQEAVAGIYAGGHAVSAFAPTANGRDVLKKEGFAEAETLQRLLIDMEMQKSVAGRVLWIDEAGLVSVPDMAKLMRVVEEQHCRLVLSGDSRQHSAVARGDALRLLESEAGIRPAEVQEIMRQRGAYKEAVASVSSGDIAGGFARFDAMGAVIELNDASRHRQLALDYARETDAGRNVLVVSPTHKEKDAVTSQIRDVLQHDGRLGDTAHRYTVLRDLRWTEAERSDPGRYHGGEVVKFVQNAPGIVRGARVTIDSQNEATFLPLDAPERFKVYAADELELRTGDLIRITDNGETMEGNRLNNGSIYRIRSFDASGNLVLDENGWTVSKSFGHIDHGYCTTSVSSQGSTVDTVLLAMSSDSIPATSREQFYVSVSRGRTAMRLYTDDKDAIRKAVELSRTRGSATELLEEAVTARGAPAPRKERLAEHTESVTRLLKGRAQEEVRERTASLMEERVAGTKVSEANHMGGIAAHAPEARR